MPLIESTSKKALNKNIATEVKAGRPVKQAVAIGYSEQRRAEHKAGAIRRAMAETAGRMGSK